MLDFILLGLVNCAVIVGFHLAVQFQYFEPKAEIESDVIDGTKNILWFIKWNGDKYLPIWLRKPLYDCPRCMASLHSTYVYFTLGTLYLAPQITTIQFIYLYPVYILMLSGMVEIIIRRFEI